MKIAEVKRLMGGSARQILTAGETGQMASMDPRERMSAFSFYFICPQGFLVLNVCSLTGGTPPSKSWLL